MVRRPPDLPGVSRILLPVLCYATGGLAVAAVLDYLRIGNRFARQRHLQDTRRKPTDG